jgi:hypothetical protein
MVYHLPMNARSGFVLACLTAAMACGGEEPPGQKRDPGMYGEQCQPGGSFDINGVAGVLATLNVHINAMGLVDTEASAELLLLMEVSQAGLDVEVVATPCGLTIPDVPVAGQDKPVHFELSPALIRSVRPVSGRGRLDGDRTCATVTCDPITILIGARLSPPSAGVLPEADASGRFNACLPTTASCYDAITTMCACDQEMDGKPGATLKASNVPGVPLDEVYVNLRTTFSLSGQVWSSDLIQGEVSASLEQGILGCSKAGGVLCNAGETTLVKNLNPKVTQSEQDPSVFRGVRVAPGTSCDDLIAMRDMLFGR